MTFLSATPDTFVAEYPISAAPSRAHLRQAPVLAQCAAMLVFVAALTIPGAVAQAKWNKLGLVATFVQHRCVAAFSA